VKRSIAIAGLVALMLVAAARARRADEPIHSVALDGTVHARVVLPDGYDSSTERYPVVYFLHGLPATAQAYEGNDWILDAMAQAGPAILVFVQGARGSDTDAEYLNWGAGRNWETYISKEIPEYIDSHFRTIASRKGRAIIGVSAGGYGATIIGLHNLARYSVIESWSGYFHATDPTGTTAVAGPNANAHNFIQPLHKDERNRPTLLAFYIGKQDSYPQFVAENKQFDQELTAAHVPHLFELYSGGHTVALWSRQAVTWLKLALSRLAKPQ
jgi:S-formylglutathione hydrolase FrmB